MRKFLCTLGALASMSCAIPATPSRASDAAGYAFCMSIGNEAQSISAWFGTLAWLLAIVVLVCLVLGSLIGNNWENGKVLPWYQRGRGLLVSGLGLALVPFAYYCFSRANAAAVAAAAANQAMKLETREEAYDSCIDAKSIWIASRTDSNGIGLTALKQAESAKAQAASADKSSKVANANIESSRVAVSEAASGVKKLVEAQTIADKDAASSTRNEALAHVARATEYLQAPLDAGVNAPR